MRNQAAAEQNVARRGDVVARFVPKIRQPQQRQVQQKYKDKNDPKDQRRISARPPCAPPLVTPGILQNCLLSECSECPAQF